MLRNKVLISLFLMSSLFAKEIIAVLDLEQIGLTPQEAQILTQRLTTKLISLNKYQVVERNNMDKILKEQEFQHSGCSDSECAVEIGQLLNSDYIIIGSVNRFGKTYAIDARLIDVGLGKSIISAEFTMKGEIDALLTTGITSIAKQLCGTQAPTTDEAVEVNYKLTKKDTNAIPDKSNMGFLKVSVYPVLAHIYIDGDLKSKYNELTTGKHALKVSYPEYDDFEVEIEIKLDETTELGIMLSDKNKPAPDNKKKKQPPQADPNKVYNIEIGDSFTIGPKNAKVTIIEWMDFQ